MAKKRVYQVAKEFNISSEALLKILREMKIEVKSHMSSVEDQTVSDIKRKFDDESKAVKQEEDRKRELHEAKPAPPVEKKPRPVAKKAEVARPKPPPQKKGQGAPQKGRGRGPKRQRVVDEKLVRESIKKTLADLDIGKKKRRRRKAAPSGGDGADDAANRIQVTELATVSELASALEIDPSDLIKQCVELGLMVSMNRRLDRDTIEMLAEEHGYEVEFLSEYGDKPVEEEDPGAAERMVERHPVVTIMGHVDHGKTSLLDHIRKSNVIAGEQGGITQHIGAYEVQLKGGSITFLDTPGHAAFSAMRARGAQVTDVVVLVVAADDSVMPQTKEAIDHAKAADVPIIIAVNKIDRPDSDPLRIKQQLAEVGLQVEDWGGTTVSVDVSAKTGENVEKLLEMILLEAELLELRADPTRPAKGTVVEARLEQGRGVVVTCLIQEGTVRKGDSFVVGAHSGRVRALFDERKKRRKEAGPSSAVEILGASGVPQAGDSFIVFANEKDAKEVASKRQQQMREQSLRYQKRMSLDELYEQIQSGGVQKLLAVVKGDVDGSVEAVTDALQQLSTDEVKVEVIHRGVGSITESDVLLAAASNAVIIGFHAKAETKAAALAEKEGVDIRFFGIIYEAVDAVKKAMEGMLTPDSQEVVSGQIEVRQLFKVGRSSVVAGSYVRSGSIDRNSRVRVIREDNTIYEGRVATLKRFKEDVREVKEGYECGITLEGFTEFQEGDILEIFRIEEVARTL